METLKKSGIDFERLRQSSLEGSRAADSVADNASDYMRDDDDRSADASPGRSSRGERSPDRESTGHESLSHRSRQEASASPSAPEYTQEYDDDDGSSVVEEELDADVA